MNEKSAKAVRKFSAAFGLNVEGVKKLKAEVDGANGPRRAAILRELRLYVAKRQIKDSPLALPKPQLILP